jgi:hypothetical protein
MGKTNKFFLGAALFALTCGGAAFLTLKGNQVQETDATTTGTVKYTNASISNKVLTLTTSGTVPTGISVAGYNGYNNTTQISSNQAMTYTFTVTNAITISSMTLSMKSNASSGSGSLSYAVDGGTAVSLVSAKAFNTTDWYGSWSSTFVDVTKTIGITASSSFVVTITNTDKSLYCQSISLVWSQSGTAIPSVTLSPKALTMGSNSTSSTEVSVAVANFTGDSVTYSATSSDSKLTVGVSSGYLSITTGSFTAQTSVTVTVTATGVSNSSETATDTAIITVNSTAETPIYEYVCAKADFTTETQMAADGATSVTGCLVQNGASSLGETGNKETWYSSYTYSTLATDTASLPYVGSLDSSRGLQFGTTKHPFAVLNFESGLFVAHQGVSNEYSISKITVDAATASGNNGVATLNVLLDGTAVGSATTLTSTSTVYTFTTSTVKTGHIKLAFANPGTSLSKQAAIYIKNIKVYGECTDAETGVLYHLGQDLEKLDTCNIAKTDWTTFKNTSEAVLEDTYANIYGAYTTELASVSLYDYAATGTGARAKTATVTAAAKYAAIASRIAASGQAKVSLAGSSESYITLSVFAVLGGLALAGFFFLKKKRLEA